MLFFIFVFNFLLSFLTNFNSVNFLFFSFFHNSILNDIFEVTLHVIKEAGIWISKGLDDLIFAGKEGINNILLSLFLSLLKSFLFFSFLLVFAKTIKFIWI